MLNKNISKDEINNLDLLRFSGEVVVVNNLEHLQLIINLLKNEKVLGFDTESRPVFNKGESYDISLLQLSTLKKAYLFRLNELKQLNCLFELLSDEKILKVGVAVRDDILGLQKLLFFEARGFIELADFGKRLNIQKLGLRSLCALLLQKRISKGAKLSNWENKVLSKSQISYAATDAWVGLKLYYAFLPLLE